MRLELPSTGDARTLVIAVDHVGSKRYLVVDLSDQKTPNLPVLDPLGDEARFELALYAETVEELELSAGTLIAEKDPFRAVPLPEAETYFETAVDAGRAIEWSSPETRPPLLDALRMRSETEVCARFEITVVELPFSNFYRFIVPDGDGIIVSEHATRKLYRVSRTQSRELLTLPEVAVAGYRAPDGELFLGCTGAVTLRGPPEGPYTETSSMSPGSYFAPMRLAGPTAPAAPLELYALSVESAFYRFDGETWERLVEGTAEDRLSDPAGLLWRSPGRAVVVLPQRDVATAYPYYERTPDNFTGYQFPNLLHGRVVHMALAQGRALALTHLSQVVQLDDHGNTFRIDAPVIADPSGIAEYEDGFLYFGGGLEIVQQKPRIGYCPTMSWRTPIEPRAMAFIDGGMVLIGDGREALFLRRLPPE